MRKIALVFVLTMIGSMISGSPASARPGGAHGFEGSANGRPGWQESNPPGFSMGKKSGWDYGTPPGWRKGQKKGWQGRAVPPGLYRR